MRTKFSGFHPALSHNKFSLSLCVPRPREWSAEEIKSFDDRRNSTLEISNIDTEAEAAIYSEEFKHASNGQIFDLIHQGITATVSVYWAWCSMPLGCLPCGKKLCLVGTERMFSSNRRRRSIQRVGSKRKRI